MPDWKRLVAERLAASKLTSEVQRELTAEIAEHLEDCCDELVRAGSVDPERETLAEVADWNALCRKIRRSKEGPMNCAIQSKRHRSNSLPDCVPRPTRHAGDCLHRVPDAEHGSIDSVRCGGV